MLSTWKGDDVVLRHSHVMTLSLVTCSISLSTNLAGVPGYSRTLAQFSSSFFFFMIVDTEFTCNLGTVGCIRLNLQQRCILCKLYSVSSNSVLF